MSGKRLLDAVALFNASRAVATRHLGIRLKQLEVYSKTSSLAKALKKQTNSNAQANSSLATTFRPSSNAAPSRQSAGDVSFSTENIPSREIVEDSDGTQVPREGLRQDHHYRAVDNVVADEVPSGELDVQQVEAKRHPLPDGTIIPGGADLGSTKAGRDVYNQRPTTEPAKTPLEQMDLQSTTLEPESSSRSSIPDPEAGSFRVSGLSSKNAKILQRQSESQIPSKAAEPPAEEEHKVRGAQKDNSIELGVGQERDIFYRAPDSASPVLSALPRVKVPKHTGDFQGGDAHIEANVNADVFYSPDDQSPEASTRKEQGVQEPSEEVMNQIFHSPRVARILGGKRKFGTWAPKHFPSMPAD